MRAAHCFRHQHSVFSTLRVAELVYPERERMHPNPRYTLYLGKGNSSEGIVSTTQFLLRGCELRFSDSFYVIENVQLHGASKIRGIRHASRQEKKDVDDISDLHRVQPRWL